MIAFVVATTGVEPVAPPKEGNDLWTHTAGSETVVSPDGKLLVAIIADGLDFDGVEPKKLILWGTATGTELHEWEDKQTPYSLAITNDGKALVSLGVSNEIVEIRVWNLPSGKLRFAAPLTTARGDLMISADDSKAYLMNAGEGYFAIDLADGRVTTLLEGGWGDVVVAPRTMLAIHDGDALEVFKTPEEFASRQEPIDVASTILYAKKSGIPAMVAT